MQPERAPGNEVGVDAGNSRDVYQKQNIENTNNTKHFEIRAYAFVKKPI